MWNFLKIDCLLTKCFTENFKEKNIIIKEKKIKYQIWKIFSQKKHPRKNLPKTWVYTNHSIFWRSYWGCKNWIFPWKTIRTDIFDWVWGTFFCGLFSRYLFFSGQGENTPGKKPTETQSVKIQVKLGERLVRKNVGKIMQNVDSPRVTPKSAKLTWYPILKTQS